MMNVSEVSLLPPGIASPALNRHDPKAAAVEFDAMVLELLLQQSGLLGSLGAEEGMESTLLGEMLLPNLARQLAAQIDLGFGSLLLSQAQPLEGETVK